MQPWCKSRNESGRRGHQVHEPKQMGDRIKGYQWEFNLVNSPDVNAWCMPGGKVVVYAGLLPVTQDETSLAIVMGHEIARGGTTRQRAHEPDDGSAGMGMAWMSPFPKSRHKPAACS